MLRQIGAYFGSRGLGLGLIMVLFVINNNEEMRNRALEKRKVLNSVIVCYYLMVLLEILQIVVRH